MEFSLHSHKVLYFKSSDKAKIIFQISIEVNFHLKNCTLNFFIKVNGVNHIRFGIQASLRHEQNKHKEFQLLTL